MQPHAEAAVTRLGYLHPSLRFLISADGIAIDGTSEEGPEHLRQEVLYAVYREKIFAEALPLRRALLAAVTEA
jgi:hypothetical protein